LGKWAHRVNLIGTTLDYLEPLIFRDVEEVKSKLSKIMKTYFTSSNYKGYTGIHFVAQKHGLDWKADLSITTATEDHKLFLYQYTSGYETIGVARTLYFDQWIKSSECRVSDLNKVKEVIPVFYCLERELQPRLSFEGCDNKKDLQRTCKRPWFLTITDEVEPIWTTKDNEIITTHPLMID
jgi:hypothetical protein